MKRFAVVSPLIVWGLYYSWLSYAFGGLTWLVGTLPDALVTVWFGMIPVTSLAGSAACCHFFLRGGRHAFIYYFSFFPCFLFFVFFSLYLLDSIHHFFGWLGNGVLFLLFFASFSWFIALLFYFVIRERP